jgi:hypothetical protein
VKQADVAKHLDLSLRRLREHYASGTIPKGGTLDEQRTAYVRHLRERAANRAPLGDVDPARERGLKDREIRLGLEQKRLREAGELISAEEVLETWTRMILIARSRLLGVPSRLASEVVDCRDLKSAERILKNEIYDALRELGDPANNERLLAEAKEETENAR